MWAFLRKKHLSSTWLNQKRTSIAFYFWHGWVLGENVLLNVHREHKFGIQNVSLSEYEGFGKAEFLTLIIIYCYSLHTPYRHSIAFFFFWYSNSQLHYGIYVYGMSPNSVMNILCVNGQSLHTYIPCKLLLINIEVFILKIEKQNEKMDCTLWNLESIFLWLLNIQLNGLLCFDGNSETCFLYSHHIS